MNRRTFLLGLGAAACTPAKPPEKLRVSGYRTARPDAVYDSESNLAPNPLEFHGDQLVQRTSDGIWVWESIAMKRLRVIDKVTDASFVDRDGAIITFTSKGASCEIRRIDATSTWLTASVSCGMPKEILILRGATSETFFVVIDDQLVPHRIAGGRFETDARIAISPQKSTRAQMFSLEDGRVLLFGNGIEIVEAGKPTRTIETPGRTLRHLARARDEHLWYSHATGKNTSAFNAIALARIDSPMQPEARFDLAPGRVVHMASGGSALAVLAFTRLTKSVRWEVAVLDEDLGVRWHAEVPESFASLALNRIGAVAISDMRVVLRGVNDSLLAWNAQTGEPIAIAPTA